MINLLDYDPAGLAALFAERGEKPFRARQVLRWVHHGLSDRVEAMTDLAQATRERARARCRDPRPGGAARLHRQRRHAQVAARRRRRQRDRDGLHPRARPRHAVHFLAGRLRARLRLLLDRQAGIQPQPGRGRDHRPALARQPHPARRRRRHTLGRARPAPDHQRGADGHGRTARQFRQRRRRAKADARRQRLRPLAPAGDAVDVGPRARRSTACARNVRSRSPSHCTRRTTRCATCWCRSIASIRCAICSPPASATSSARRATSSPSNT